MDSLENLSQTDLFQVLDILDLRELDELRAVNLTLNNRIQNEYLPNRPARNIRNDQGLFDWKSVEKAISLNSRLLFDYLYTNFPELVHQYYSETTNFKYLQKQAPSIFKSSYPRYCQGARQPRIYSPVEASYWKDRPIFENDQPVPRPILSFSHEGSQIYFISPHDKYPYPSARRNLKTRDIIPCSFSTP